MKNNLKAIVLLGAVFLTVSCEKTFDSYKLDDVPTNFLPLEKPEIGKGFQLHIEPFPIQANYEREFYIRKPLGNTELAYLTGFEMKARAGTHHLIAYSFAKGAILPKENVMYDQNMPNNTLAIRSGQGVGGALFQSPQANYKFSLPAGYALEMSPNTSFLMNSHYFNKTSATRFGEVYINFYTKPKAEVKQILEVEYLSPEEIVLPPNKKTTLVTDFIMDKETIIPTMLSHYHKRGELFEVYIKGGARNGELIYSSDYYEDPKIVNFSPLLVLKKGEGLTSKVTYNNTSNRTVRFGITSEDEMNIIILFKHKN